MTERDYTVSESSQNYVVYNMGKKGKLSLVDSR
jgi:hypothetical protein